MRIGFKNILLMLVGVTLFLNVHSQGYNHVWLLGSTGTDTNVTHPDGRLLFYLDSVSVVGEQRKMAFSSTQATISNENEFSSYAFKYK